MEQQEYLIKISAIQQEAAQLEEKLRVIEQQIQDMFAVNASLKDIDKNKEKEMLSNLGKGIFIKTELKDKELFVNVGKEIIVKKNIKDTAAVVENQIERLIEGKKEIFVQIENLQKEMLELVRAAEREQKRSK